MGKEEDTLVISERKMTDRPEGHSHSFRGKRKGEKRFQTDRGERKNSEEHPKEKAPCLIPPSKKKRRGRISTF